MPGDSHVRFPSVGHMGALNQTKAIDSHSRSSGDFTEAREIGGQTTYLTKAGAQAFDAFLNNNDMGVTPRVEKDPTWFQKLWKTTPHQVNEGNA
jgi:hypothetical protein